MEIKIISNEKNWMESNAITQLKSISNFNGMRKIFGMPDLHPGKIPVGVSFITEDILYPHIIGSDIGCGMSFFSTSINKNKINFDKLIKKFESNDIYDLTGFMDSINESIIHEEKMGTIGGGNHFAEIQELYEIIDTDLFDKLNITKKELFLLVHSGSRFLGFEILDKYIKQYSAQNGFEKNDDHAIEYLKEHDYAINWAKLNREAIAYKMINTINTKNEIRKVIDGVHNGIEVKKIHNKEFFIHRKGATGVTGEFSIVPGSRGSLTYIVSPINECNEFGYSIAHGAGRKWERSVCKNRLKDFYTKDSIKTTKYKSRVICNEKDLLYEEAPEAYKNIENVINSMVEANMIKVVATLKPILTYKN